jgi:hypothetical protein
MDLVLDSEKVAFGGKAPGKTGPTVGRGSIRTHPNSFYRVFLKMQIDRKPWEMCRGRYLFRQALEWAG